MNTSKKTFQSITKENMEIINKYIDYYAQIRKGESSTNTLRNIKTTLKKLADYIKEKKFADINKEDLMNFFNNKEIVKNYKSADTYANHLIPFYRWINNLNKTTRPKIFEWYNYTTQREKDKHYDPNRKQKLFVETEHINKLLNHFYDKLGQTNALFELYYLSGARTSEIITMKIHDVIIDKTPIRIIIPTGHSKTRPREIPLFENPKHLMVYLCNHPNKNNENAYLFFPFTDTNKPITADTVRTRFRKALKDLELPKTFTIRGIRETRTTLSFKQNMSQNDMMKLYGWKPNTVLQRATEYDLSNIDDLAEKNLKNPYIPDTPKTLEQRDKEKEESEKKIQALEQEIQNLKTTIETFPELLKELTPKYFDIKPKKTKPNKQNK